MLKQGDVEADWEANHLVSAQHKLCQELYGLGIRVAFAHHRDAAVKAAVAAAVAEGHLAADEVHLARQHCLLLASLEEPARMHSIEPVRYCAIWV